MRNVSQVVFTMDNGTKINNIISEGPQGELYLTFTFAWLFPGVKSGSAEETKIGEERGLSQMAPKALKSSLDKIEEMAAKGEI